jgi:hypothetical protein
MAVMVAAAFGLPGIGHAALSKEERKSEQDRIESTYKAAKAKCDGLKGNAKDICMAEAKGGQKVAKAELDARDKGTAKEQANVRVARAEAEYEVAKEKCDDLKGNDKDVCVKDAKATLTRARNDARVAKESAAASKDSRERVAEARKDAREDTRQAEYKAARERCDSMAGDAKDRCQKDVRDRFGK